MENKPIFVLKPKFHTEEILEEIKICLDKGWTGMGFKTIEFEEAWKKYTKLPNAHFVNSCTSGLHLAINILKKEHQWQDNDEIITTPLTFVSTNHVILYEKLQPVFADIDEYLCLDPKSIEKNITQKTRAVMFVGIGGNPGRLQEVSNLCKKNNLKLILDAAHMAGTKIINKEKEIHHVGREADVTVFSFHSVKNLPTSDSGMVCFKDNNFDKQARKMSWMGIDKDTYSRSDGGKYSWNYDIKDLGFKYHGNSVIAAIGLVQLKYLDEDNSKRNAIVNTYLKYFKEYNVNQIETIPISPYCHKSSRHFFQIKVHQKHRNKLIEYMCKNNIYPSVHYVDNSQYEIYQKYKKSCPTALNVSQEIITLPLHLDITNENVNNVIQIIKGYFNDRKY